MCLSAAEYAALDEKSRENKGVECNDRCVNRMLSVECSSSCRFSRSGKCRNQRLTKRQVSQWFETYYLNDRLLAELPVLPLELQYKKVKLIKTEQKGFGLKVMENVTPGELVMELVGELIDSDECEKRMW